jgi:isocitrate/isopropylmalate dehydrogenase
VRRFGVSLHVDEFDFANCDYHARHGKMMPDDWKDRIGGHDAIRFGAVGWPATVPDHVGSLITMPYWDERVAAMSKAYPDVTVDRCHIDILCGWFVQRPQIFDVVVASNLFGDILSDLGPACTGTIGIAPSANVNPTRRWPSLFEPVHGSAPDIAGRGVANPIGQVWSAALMLDFLGHRDAHDAILGTS